MFYIKGGIWFLRNTACVNLHFTDVVFGKQPTWNTHVVRYM